jgi:NAD(P)H-dependent FMN reductase
MSEIVIIACSDNNNLKMAKEFEKAIRPSELSTKLVDLVSLGLPLYTSKEEARGIPTVLQEYIELFDKAQGFVIVAPEYNGGVPPAVTNLIAWISRGGGKDWRQCFNNKPAAIGSFSGGGGVQLLSALRIQLSYIGLNVLGRQTRATQQMEINLEEVKDICERLVKLVLVKN